MADARTHLLAAGLALSVSALTTSLFLASQPVPESIRAPLALRSSPPAQPAAAKAAAKPEFAETDGDVHGYLVAAKGASRLYVFEIPADAARLELSARSDEWDLELRASCGTAVPERDEDWTWVASADGDDTKLSLTRHADSDLRPGPLLVEVRPALAPGHRDDAESLAFTLRADATRLAAPREIAPGIAVDAATSPATGHRCDFVFDVPPDTVAVRIDLVEAARDLDLLASSQGPAFDGDAAQWTATSMLGREALVLDADSDPVPPTGGRVWFGVVDPSLYDAPVRFRVVVTLGTEPPAEALVLPELPQPADPRDRAVAAVVEIVVDDGSGSGTIVTEEGLVLTALHVIGERTGEDGDISVAIDLDTTRMTRELFRAEVVKSDDDLDVALLRITSGLYGQPLPPGYRFPACPVAFDGLPRLGDPLVTIGFPEPAGTGSRSPVMYSKGVVSGFEREKAGLRIKTDAFVASGSSGGAALDDRYRLVGVPVFTIAESDGTAQTGFLVPVMELPRAWREMIGGR